MERSRNSRDRNIFSTMDRNHSIYK